MSGELRHLMKLVDLARVEGARGCEIYVERSSGLSARVLRGRVTDRDELSERFLIARCWLEGGRMGERRVDLADGDDGAAAIHQALQAAATADEDPLSGPVGRLAAGASRGLGIEDRRFAGLSPADRVDVAVAAERGARGVDRRILTDRFTYVDRYIERFFANSKDVAASEVGTTYRADGVVRVAGDHGELRIDDFIEGRTFASISSLPFGVTLARRAIDLLKTGEPLLGQVRIMMPPRVTAMLVQALAPAFLHEALESGDSVFSKAGDASFVHPRLHLLDDGTLPGALRTSAFDDRGITPLGLTLLREGVVEGRYLDVRDARVLDEQPTGHHTGGRLVPRNLILRSGTRSMNAILSDGQGDVFFLDHVADLAIDLHTGALSCVGSGHVYSGARQQHAVQHLRLSGNLIDILARVVDVASDTDRVGHVDAPGVLVDGFTVSA